ncbi:MAG TPA: ankyrin repeat domain-containing protein [Candidatus Limnocylindrales bacterium]
MVDGETTLDRSDEAELFAAVEANDPHAIDELLADRPELAWARNDDDLTAVMVARYRFAMGALDRLLDARGDDLDLFEAAAVGRADLVEAAIARDPSVARSWSSDGFTALHLAAFFGSTDVAWALIGAGADVDAVSDNEMTVRPLHSAAAGRHVAICRALVEAGADVNAAQRGGFTPLMSAARNGDAELVELLLAAGANATGRADDGHDAADLALSGGHAELAARLRSA